MLDPSAVPRLGDNPPVQPPSSPPAQGESLYEAFYGLREQPFALSTDPRFLFLGASHLQVYNELLTALRRREGLLLLTGETGTGKTTLCRAVINALGPRTFSALILNPYMSDAEIVRVILREFGLVSRDEIRRGALANADTPQLLDTLEGFLRSLLPLSSYAVVVIDEAQSLAPRVLDQIRVLGSFEQDGQRLLQIVLVGHPDLNETVRVESLRAMNERISRRMALSPLTPPEVDAYIRHRLAVAGAGENVMFTPDAVAFVTERSRGLPRRVNLLCDRALEEGRMSGTSEIGADLVIRAAKALVGSPIEPIDDFRSRSVATEPENGQFQTLEREVTLTLGQTPTPTRSRRALWLLLLVAFVAAGAAGAYAWSIGSQPLDLPPAPEMKLRIGAPPPTIPVPPDEPPPPKVRPQPAEGQGIT